jgi:hypothetical protein
MRLTSGVFERLFEQLEFATTRGDGYDALNKFLAGCPVPPEGRQRVIDVAHRYIERLPEN